MYDEAVKGYERSLKLDPSQNEVRLRFDALKEMFGTAKTDLPPLVIESLKCDELFAAMYKFYADNPIGTITIENSTGKPIDRLTVETEVKNYMDYPTESRPVRSIQPGEKIRVQLFALFNNRILSLTEDSPLAVKLRIRYSVGGKEYEAGAAGNITVYNRNALTWDTTEKLASFITSRDSAVKTCARGTVQIFRNSRYPFMTQNLQSAIEIFDALGAYGMAYVPDPRTPFASYSKLRDKVDYVQYPRDTLRFKTGDCDDLTSLYCALLENIGIETAFITVPGHILMMLNTGVPAANRLQVSSKTELLVEYQGTIWVPVETTMLGKPFVDAWNAGSSTIDKNKKSGSVVFVAVKKAWERYAPVTLDDSSWEPALPQRDAIDRLFSADINTLIERELMPRVKDLNVSFNKSRSAQDANLIGIAYARFGRYPEAEVWFKKALDINPKYHQSATNLGNVYLLTSRQDDAKRMYDTAMGIKKDDARLHLNLAIFYRKKGDVPGATKEYRAAIAIDPDIAKGYAWLDSKSDASRSSMEDDSPLWVER
jgi:tetratricopeptide (TPR) repeat protein